MSDHFQGRIEQVESKGDRLLLRCVRHFDPTDGFIGNEVWLWEITNATRIKPSILRSLTGKNVDYFEVKKVKNRPTLIFSLNDYVETIAISGSSVRRKTKPYKLSDLIGVIESLRGALTHFETESAKQRNTISDVETFVQATIHRIRARFDFEKDRQSPKADPLNREIEDLETILKKLKDPDQASRHPDPSAPSA